MAKLIKYFKIGPKASIFFDTQSRLKVTKNVPGMFKGSKLNRRMTEAIGSGHIQEIEEDDYNEMMAAHEKATVEGNAATAAKLALKKGLQKALAPEEEKEETVEELEQEEEQITEKIKKKKNKT